MLAPCIIHSFIHSLFFWVICRNFIGSYLYDRVLNFQTQIKCVLYFEKPANVGRIAGARRRWKLRHMQVHKRHVSAFVKLTMKNKEKERMDMKNMPKEGEEFGEKSLEREEYLYGSLLKQLNVIVLKILMQYAILLITHFMY